MKFYEEAPEKEDVIKNAYIAEIRGYAKYADEEFLAYATVPKNIIVHRELACYLTATYDISIRMTYSDKHYYEHTKGLNVEARQTSCMYPKTKSGDRTAETNLNFSSIR